MDKLVNNIETIFYNLKILDFLKENDNVYIGGSLPFMLFNNRGLSSSEISKIIDDIDIYTTNAPLLIRNINKKFKVNNLIKTGVNIKFNIEECEKPLQIITSYFESFNDEVLDGYDCDLVRVGYHPASSKFIIHDRFIVGLKTRTFIVYYERSNNGRIQKLKDRAHKYFASTIEVVKETEDGDYRPYWKKKNPVKTLSDVGTSPPYIQLYCNKYKCCLCHNISEYLLCKKCEVLIDKYHTNTKFDNFKLDTLTVFGGVNGLGKIIADEAEIMGIKTSRTSRTVKNIKDCEDEDVTSEEEYPKIPIKKITKPIEIIPIKKTAKPIKKQTDLLQYNIIIYCDGSYEIKQNEKIIKAICIDKFDEPKILHKFNIKENNLDNVIKSIEKFIDDNIEWKKIIKVDNKFYFSLENNALVSPELMNKIFESDCVVFNAYQTLENNHSIWTTDINNFNEKLALERFKINCFGYVKLLQQIIKRRKEIIAENKNPKDIIFVCMDANESKFEDKLQDGKHLELNMAKTAFKQIFYTNAQVLASLGIITVFYDPCWLSYHGISVDKIASKSKFLIPPSICAKVLLNYIKNINIDNLYKEKKYVHDTTFYKCIKNYKIVPIY